MHSISLLFQDVASMVMYLQYVPADTSYPLDRFNDIHDQLNFYTYLPTYLPTHPIFTVVRTPNKQFISDGLARGAGKRIPSRCWKCKEVGKGMPGGQEGELRIGIQWQAGNQATKVVLAAESHVGEETEDPLLYLLSDSDSEASVRQIRVMDQGSVCESGCCGGPHDGSRGHRVRSDYYGR